MFGGGFRGFDGFDGFGGGNDAEDETKKEVDTNKYY